MAKKSISDLERYRDLLKVKAELAKSKIKEIMLVLEFEKYDFLEESEMLEVLLNKVDLLKYEIEMAMFSNVIKIDGDEMPLKQAEDNLITLRERLAFYQEIRDVYVLPARERAIHGGVYTMGITMEDVDIIVQNLHEDIYSVNEKVQKRKDTIKVDIEMKDFVIEDIMVIGSDEVSISS